MKTCEGGRMPLFTVSVIEHGGTRVQTRIRATTDSEVIALAVEKIWGSGTYWKPCPDAPTAGRVYYCTDVFPSNDVPRTGLATVDVRLTSKAKKGAATMAAETQGAGP
jgi:hypothetical protein